MNATDSTAWSTEPNTGLKATRLVLTGFMGAGKSSIGKLVAKQLNWPFTDTDTVIERMAGQPIDRLFETRGEAAFRQLERRALEGVLNGPERCVIATGGGTLATQENLNWAKTHGTVVYLEATLEELFERVVRSPKARPLVKTVYQEEGPEAALAAFKTRFAQREPFYRQATVKVHSTGKLSGQVAEMVIEAVKVYQLWNPAH